MICRTPSPTFVNDAAESLWPGVPGALARELSIASVELVTRRIETLDPEAIDAACKTARPAMLDRTRHWHRIQPKSALR